MSLQTIKEVLVNGAAEYGRAENENARTHHARNPV
jgi:hypothetical protein